MKTAEPKIIYLQIGDDADISEFEESDFQTNAISWCWERIFPNDIEYVSKSNLLLLIDEMIDKRETKTWYSQDEVDEILVELKQKIEQLDKEV